MGGRVENKRNMETSWNLTTDLTKTFIHFYLENHPRTDVSVVRITPMYFSHGVKSHLEWVPQLDPYGTNWGDPPSNLQNFPERTPHTINNPYKWPYKWLTRVVITYTTPYILTSAPSISTPPPPRPFQPLPGKKLHHVTKVSASMSPSSSSATSPHRSRRR